jgi:uncharacterized protein (DUF58 family)
MEPYFDSAFLKKLELLTILSRKVFKGKLRGEQRSQKRGSGVEFADYRSYCEGDDYRRIDWNAYARLEDLFLKLYREEEDLSVYILLDRSTSMDFGEPSKLEYAKRIAAALSYIALANLDRVSVSGFAAGRGPSMPLIRGKGNIFRIFGFLEEIEAAGITSLENAVADFCAREKRPGVVIILSDFFEEGDFEKALKRMKYTIFEPMVIHLLAEEEVNPQVGGDYRFVDCETASEVDLSLDGLAIKRYGIRLRQFCERLESFCNSHAIGYLRTVTRVAFEDLILHYLRRVAFIR